MKLLPTLLLLLLTTNCWAGTMDLTTTGVVFPCLNEDTHPWGTCFKVNNTERWGIETPMYDPKPGTIISITFTFTKFESITHGDSYYVTNIKLNKKD